MMPLSVWLGICTNLKFHPWFAALAVCIRWRGAWALEKEKKAPVIAVLKSVFAIVFKVTHIVMRYSSIRVFGDGYFKEAAGVIHWRL